MITEDKVAEIFVLQMISAKFLMHRWQNIRLRQKERVHPKSLIYY